MGANLGFWMNLLLGKLPLWLIAEISNSKITFQITTPPIKVPQIPEKLIHCLMVTLQIFGKWRFFLVVIRLFFQKQRYSVVSIVLFLEKQRYVVVSIALFLEKQRYAVVSIALI